MKQALPKEIEAKMKLWRQGLSLLPQEYIEFHKQLAFSAKWQVELDYIIHREYMASDGWCDGMRVLHLIVEGKETGTLLKVFWDDGTQTWFKRIGMGSVRLFSPYKEPTPEMALERLGWFYDEGGHYWCKPANTFRSVDKYANSAVDALIEEFGETSYHT